MPTTTLKFDKIGKEDLEIGTGTFEVELSDGRRATLNRINLSSFLASDAVDTAVYFTNSTAIGQDSDFVYNTTTKQLTLGDSASALRVGSTGTAGRGVHVAGVGDTGLRIDNSDAGAGDAILEFALHGTVDWHIAADDTASDNLVFSSGTSVSTTPHLVLFRDTVNVAIGTPTANSFNDAGLTINQQAADDHILSLMSSDVAHGITDLANTAEYGFLRKETGTTGGMEVFGLSSDRVGLKLTGIMTTESTADGDAGNAAVEVNGLLKSGTGSTALGATGNIFGVRSDTTLVFIVNGDGDVSNSGGSTTMGTYDDYDDVKLLSAVKGAMDVSFKKTLGEWVDEHTEILERGGVIKRDGDRYWISQRGWRGLLIDALRQLDSRIASLESLATGGNQNPALTS